MIIDYFPAGDKSFASSRLRVFKIAEALSKLGHSICINDYRLFDKDIVIVQKRIDCDEVMRQARAQGIRVIYDLDDYIPGLSTHLADVVTVDTPAKRDLYPNAVVIPDALDIEDDSPFKTEHRERLESVVTVCNADNLYHVVNAAQACESLGLELTIITDLKKASWEHFHDAAGVQWALEGVDTELVKHDLFIAPIMLGSSQWSDEWVRSKSPNRILKAWGLGLPVVATELPSYSDLPAYPATTMQEWVDLFRFYDYRVNRVNNAQMGCEAAQQYRAEKVAKLWLEVMQK